MGVGGLVLQQEGWEISKVSLHSWQKGANAVNL